MDALQRELVDEKRDRLIYCSPGHVVSSGFIGMLGLPVSSTTAVFAMPQESPPATADLFSRMIEAHRPITHDPRPVTGGFRSRELEWRRTHEEDLRAYTDEWVALEGENIVAHGRDPIQVVNQARARGIQTPYVFFVEFPQEDVVKMGL